ncbi:hypothetical protein CLV98_102377 [Dyadobacter jejuensis]|uniref:Uncharacterized protein n=1 Tax=Dyadobacter jejuensis TaxID=1082580 RepID=A0A316APB3_9BACT|nr:hypothetical protein [Dyadobacter jejuensis]PWJ59543.1 hypothetical protein CLV98_102377 [Dyadobacter jejuensis]
MNRQQLVALVLASMCLATAWAIRGQFGHEQGAAWAGGIGALAIVLLARRADWYAKALQLSLASAVGWGVGGIISYGMVVGYGHSSSFVNAYYGLGMLFVIGGLFGLLGGGMFGLVLSDRADKRVDWPQVIVEMTVGAVIFYYFIVEQMGWKMTPPRSEAWAACFGMTVALFWYMFRHGHTGAIRVAIFSGLGAGFGFAFGNFIQVISRESGIPFNFWNVMEYAIGFFGGLGMAYGTFTTDWPQSDAVVSKKKLLTPLVLLTLAIPFIVWEQSFGSERVTKMVTELAPSSNIEALAGNVQMGALLLVLLSSGFWLYYFYIRNKALVISVELQDIKRFLLGQLGLYAVLSLLITGAFLSTDRIEQYLYFLNLIVIGLWIDKYSVTFSSRRLNWSRWGINLVFVLAVIALFAAVAISSHGVLHHAQNRFE